MILSATALLALILLLAFANGSNDVSKGIATLVGSGISNFKTAVVWGTLWTVAGGLHAARDRRSARRSGGRGPGRRGAPLEHVRHQDRASPRALAAPLDGSLFR